MVNGCDLFFWRQCLVTKCKESVYKTGNSIAYFTLTLSVPVVKVTVSLLLGLYDASDLKTIKLWVDWKNSNGSNNVL